MLNEASTRRVLEEALKTGGDYSELFMQDSDFNTIDMVDGKVENAAYERKVGAGVRVLSGTRCAYAYTADTSEEAILKAASAAAAAIKAVPEGGTRAFELRRGEPVYVRHFSEVSNSERISVLREASDAAKAYSDEITQVTGTILDVDHRIAVANSSGVWAEDRRPRTRLFVTAVAMEGSTAQTGRRSLGQGRGFELYGMYDIKELGRKAAKTAVTMLHAPECPAGAVPVVIESGFGGVILHEACVHSLEATSVGRGNSEFCGKLGMKIASDIVTAVDDGTIPGAWGSIGYDDEGTKSQRNVLIENGILKTYLVDLLGSRRMNGHPLTGSSRRQDYTFAPTSRMTNTFFAEGKDDPEEMIRTMGEGLFATQMGGGSVNPLTGEFNFNVAEGYWVKDGRIVTPVRGATIIGKGSEVLLKIDRIGREIVLEPGMCGSMSGSIPTNVGQPRIRVSEMTVGGKGGKI